MKFHKIPEGVLKRAFGCQDEHELDSYVRLDCWGEGSCFFHSLCMLIVINNKVHNNQVTYTLDTPNSTYRYFTVPLKPTIPFCETFRQVGIQLRQALGRELAQYPKLWAKFERENKVNLGRTDKQQTAQGAVEELGKIEVWADIWTIRYCAWRLKLNVLFVNPTSAQEPIYCGVENFDQGKHTIFIYWSNHSHFEPIVQLEGDTFLRSFGQNHRFLECLRNQYKKACPLDPIGK
jgi:hypothetical protein